MADNTASVTSYDLNIATLNLNGFKNSCSYLQELLLSHDIIFVQKHWLLSCELHLLQDINNDFVVFAKSSMDDKIAHGLLVGRPFGGVAVLVRKQLSHCVSFCGCDDDGCVIYIKLWLIMFVCYYVGAIFHVRMVQVTPGNRSDE